MNVVLWVLQGFLAAAMLGAGGFKLTTRKEKFPPAMAYHEDFTQPQIRLIGIAEVLGALALILPGLLDVAEILTPIAAACLAALMIGAVVVHARRDEAQAAVGPGVLAAVAIVIAVCRFGPYPL